MDLISAEENMYTCCGNKCGDAPEIADKIGRDRFVHWIVNALTREGITTAAALRGMQDRKLIRVRSIGATALRRIRAHFPYDAPRDA